jgi:mono/diheme cytochrome c family protein
VLGTLSSLPWSEHTYADDRVLRVQDDISARVYPVEELIASLGLTELRLAEDPHFGPNRVFTGFALEPLLNHIGLGDAPEVLLLCADGYRIPLDRSKLSRRQLRGLLAVRDTALPVDGDSHWLPYKHGAEIVSFDPFYLVWASADDSIELDTKTLPWPFQLTEIRRFDRDRYFAPARPPEGADDSVKQGFDIYTDHCGKCHRMRDVGGKVGPVLDRDGSLSSLLTEAQLRDYVRHEESRFPQSKMPQFSKILRREEINQVASYLRAMEPLVPEPPVGPRKGNKGNDGPTTR